MPEPSMFTFEGDGMTLEVHADRLEVEAGKRHQTIPLAEVSEVFVTFRPKRLVILTTAGKRHQYNLARDTEAARAAITSRLAGSRSQA